MLKTLFFLFSLLSCLCGTACSMYKITVDGETVVGCNADAWYTTPHIWFEKTNNKTAWSAAFTGSRPIGKNEFAPQTGMNSQGLVFSRLTSYHPTLITHPLQEKQKISNPDLFLKKVLHQCRNIEEAEAYWNSYDHSIFIDDVFIYVDSTGEYLIVEPYTLTRGRDPNYVLSNFCPSITSLDDANKIARYRKGREFIKTVPPNTSLSYTTRIADTMHVCRKKKGDGTLYTALWNPTLGIVNLYFYHDFNTVVQFDVYEELNAKNRSIPIVSLFPKNKEFEQLKAYVTPYNTPWLRIALVFLGVFFGLSSTVLFIGYLKNKQRYQPLNLAISIIGFATIPFLYLLATNQYIYYFDAPYKHFKGGLINIASYTPFLILLAILPIIYFGRKVILQKAWSATNRILLLLNTSLYLVLIYSFKYWGLFIT